MAPQNNSFTHLALKLQVLNFVKANSGKAAPITIALLPELGFDN